MFDWFSKPKAFALDLTDSTIRLLEVHGNGKNRMRSVAHLEIPPGLIEDGRILDQAKVSELIHRAYLEAAPNHPHTKKVVAEIPESKTFTHHLSIDRNIDPKQLADEVMVRAEESLPVSLDDYAWDYQILATTPKSYEVLVAAAPGDLVKAYEETIAMAGLQLHVLELESLALMRALVVPQQIPADHAVLMVDVMERSVNMMVVDSSGLELSVTVPVALMVDAAPRATKAVKKTAKATEEKVPAAQHVSVSSMSRVMDELSKATAFYERKSSRKISEVIVTGMPQALEDVRVSLEGAFSLEASLAKPPFEMEGMDPREAAVVSGLALRAAKLSPGINFIVPA